MLESLMKRVVARRPMMMAANRPLVPVFAVEKTPVTIPVTSSMATSTLCGMVTKKEAIATTTQAMSRS